ncbi:hypothetical protein ACLB2K_037810 [Fragaria x ananassa]
MRKPKFQRLLGAITQDVKTGLRLHSYVEQPEIMVKLKGSGTLLSPPSQVDNPLKLGSLPPMTTPELVTATTAVHTLVGTSSPTVASVKGTYLQPKLCVKSREYHALHLFDKMPKSTGLCNAGRTSSALTTIRGKGGELAHQPEAYEINSEEEDKNANRSMGKNDQADDGHAMLKIELSTCLIKRNDVLTYKKKVPIDEIVVGESHVNENGQFLAHKVDVQKHLETEVVNGDVSGCTSEAFTGMVLRFNMESANEGKLQTTPNPTTLPGIFDASHISNSELKMDMDLALISEYVSEDKSLHVLLQWHKVKRNSLVDGEKELIFVDNMVDAFLYALVKGDRHPPLLLPYLIVFFLWEKHQRVWSCCNMTADTYQDLNMMTGHKQDVGENLTWTFMHTSQEIVKQSVAPICGASDSFMLRTQEQDKVANMKQGRSCMLAAGDYYSYLATNKLATLGEQAFLITFDVKLAGICLSFKFQEWYFTYAGLMGWKGYHGVLIMAEWKVCLLLMLIVQYGAIVVVLAMSLEFELEEKFLLDYDFVSVGRERARKKKRDSEREIEGKGHKPKEERERERGKDADCDDFVDEDVREHDTMRHRRDAGGARPRKNSEEEDSVTKENKATRREELEDEDEMETRRRRVQQWHERVKGEAHGEKCMEGNVDELKSAETWTLSDDDNKELRGDSMLVGSENVRAATEPASQNGDDATGDEELDPLDAYMNLVVLPQVNGTDNKDRAHTKDRQSSGEQPRRIQNKSIGRILPGEDSDSDYGDLENDDVSLANDNIMKPEKFSQVDHSKIDYQPFRRNFYIEVKDISRMSAEEVSTYRNQLELKINGKDVPKPIKTWPQTGLTTKTLEVIKKLNFEKPLPIQAQALPVIMSGRDCIGIGKTGSGKTLAYVLPMLRRMKDQAPAVSGDGPVVLIMAPTRELVQQIHSDIKKFSKVLGLRCVPVYGGDDVAQKIGELKHGADIVVCTPGRMIDLLSKNGGKITNLHRVTYLVLDEADRMDELLAREVFRVQDKPVHIQVGGRSVVNKDIMQIVEVRPKDERFLRLLELLGQWYEKGNFLIFVQTHDQCDTLFTALLKHGYPCLSLHAGKDQTDRQSTISDFKSNVCNVLVATSVAARGLDVKELEVVINFDVPNHYEDYVHRVGRTGRAGRKGCAISLISKEDERYAPDLVKALELSGQVVPEDLKSLAGNFMEKVNQGPERAHGTGYGGSGFKFDEEEDEMRKAAKKAQAKEYVCEDDVSDLEDGDDGIQQEGDDISPQGALTHIQAITKIPVVGNDGTARALAFANNLNLLHNMAKMKGMPEHYAELEINDFPQTARWKITRNETRQYISELTKAAMTPKGQYSPPGKVQGPEDRKLYLFIEGPTEHVQLSLATVHFSVEWDSISCLWTRKT